MTNAIKNNTTLKDFTKYVSLNVLGMIAFNCYILADTFFIANGVGLNGLTALNLALPVFGILSSFGLMYGLGGATQYAILTAEGKDGNRAFSMSMLLALCTAVVFEFFAVFLSEEIAIVFGANGDNLALTTEYVQMLLYFSPAFLINQVLVCFVRNDNSPALAMVAVATGSIMNVILDYVFVFPLDMGMFGAVLATGLAPVIGIVILSTHWIYKRNKVKIVFCKPDLRIIVNIFRLGIFTFIAELANAVVILLYNSILLKSVGNLGVAAYGIVVNLYYVAIAFFNGVSQGMQPLISRRYGEGKLKEIKSIYVYGIITAIVIAVGIYVVIVSAPYQIVDLFNSEKNPDIPDMAALGLLLYFTALFFSGTNVVTTGLFSAADRGGKAFVISLLRGIVIIIPMAFIMSELFGLTGTWLALPATELIVLVAAVIAATSFIRKLKLLDDSSFGAFSKRAKESAQISDK